MVLLYTHIDENPSAFIILACFIVIIVALIIFGAFLKVYDIHSTLQTHTVLLKEQQQELNKLIELQQEQIDLLKAIANQENATNVTAECSCDTDI